MKTTLLLAALTLLAGAALVPVFRPAKAVTKTPMPPERRLRHQQAGVEMDAGLDALARGDDAGARERFHTAVAIDPTAKPILDYRRALVYDRLGRDREAYGAYRDTLFGSPRTSSSIEHDPCVLARYGDLAARFGHPEDARAAYERAVQDGPHRLGAGAPSVLDDPALMASPEAAAHAEAGIEAFFTGGSDRRDHAREAFARALALAPRSPVALHGLVAAGGFAPGPARPGPRWPGPRRSRAGRCARRSAWTARSAGTCPWRPPR